MKILIVLLVLLVSSSMGQVTEQWVQRYNGSWNGVDAGYSIAVDNAGNVYVTGSTSNGSTSDFITIKYNSSGTQLWAQSYNGPGNNLDNATSIAVDLSGNVYVTGRSAGIGTSYDYATIKYSSSGDTVWIRRYTSPGFSADQVQSIVVDSWGNVYVTGSSEGDFITVKYNSKGTQQWVQRYNGPGNNLDVARKIALDPEGNVFVVGWSVGNGTSYDYATIKYNTSGDSLWVQRYNGPGNSEDDSYSLAIDSFGNIYITGKSMGAGTAIFDFATVKYNSAGVQQWVQRYNSTGNYWDEATSIATDLFGNVYVTGFSYDEINTPDYVTIKYNSIGSQQWIKKYNGTGNDYDYAQFVVTDNSGNVYVSGQSKGSNTGVYDFATVKYNSDGIQQWVQRYNGPGNGVDIPHSITIDSLGNIYVTGESLGSGTNLDIATIKYSQTIGIHPISTEIPQTYSLEQNYPNPFNPVTNINFSIPKSGNVKLTVYDASGRETATLFNGRLSAGTYNYDFDASQLASGIYFYKLESNDFMQTKKMVLVK